MLITRIRPSHTNVIPTPRYVQCTLMHFSLRNLEERSVILIIKITYYVHFFYLLNKERQIHLCHVWWTNHYCVLSYSYDVTVVDTLDTLKEWNFRIIYFLNLFSIWSRVFRVQILKIHMNQFQCVTYAKINNKL